MQNHAKKRQVKLIKWSRKLHRITGVLLMVFIIVVSVSGLLLAWKKNSNNLLQPATQKAPNRNIEQWLPVWQLKNLAQRFISDSTNQNLSAEIKRMDIRPEKGIVKVTFTQHFWELQLEGTTGKARSFAFRYSDFIEAVHDGSILDIWLENESGYIKVLYSSSLGLALCFFCLSGFWIWFGPKWLRKQKRERKRGEQV